MNMVSWKLSQLLLIAAAGAGLLLGRPASAQENELRRLSVAEIETLHRLIKPQPGESRWMEIPWLTSLWEARVRAAKEGKPIFLWYGSGGSPAFGSTENARPVEEPATSIASIVAPSWIHAARSAGASNDSPGVGLGAAAHGGGAISGASALGIVATAREDRGGLVRGGRAACRVWLEAVSLGLIDIDRGLVARLEKP